MVKEGASWFGSTTFADVEIVAASVPGAVGTPTGPGGQADSTGHPGPSSSTPESCACRAAPASNPWAGSLLVLGALVFVVRRNGRAKRHAGASCDWRNMREMP
jgi:MYXO-CTERM domain-containing protein